MEGPEAALTAGHYCCSQTRQGQGKGIGGVRNCSDLREMGVTNISWGWGGRVFGRWVPEDKAPRSPPPTPDPVLPHRVSVHPGPECSRSPISSAGCPFAPSPGALVTSQGSRCDPGGNGCSGRSSAGNGRGGSGLGVVVEVKSRVEEQPRVLTCQDVCCPGLLPAKQLALKQLLCLALDPLPLDPHTSSFVCFSLRKSSP